MKYTEVTFQLADNGVFHDMLIDTLGNEGPYESFVDTPNGIKAYIPTEQYNADYLRAVAQAFPLPLTYTAEELEDRDYNAEWESTHQAVLVHYADGGSIWVRAPFHPHRTDVNYELIIEPKMSFGTAHHPTTYMMLQYVAELPMQGLRVLDMGCGTAVLGILASMRGAEYVEAVDIDEWAYRNALENVRTNQAPVCCRMGDASTLGGTFDLVIANINRNILLRDMETYSNVLQSNSKPQDNGGGMLLSGFYEADEGALIAHANQLGYTLRSKKSRNGWSALYLTR